MGSLAICVLDVAPKFSVIGFHTFVLNVERISKCIFKSVARIASMIRNRSLFNSVSSMEVRKLFSSKFVRRCQLAAA